MVNCRVIQSGYSERISTNFHEKWRKKVNFQRKRNLNELSVNFRDCYCFNFFETRVKPKTKQELIDGITKFWNEKVSAEKCNNYIDHVLRKAIPTVIAEKGGATKH